MPRRFNVRIGLLITASVLLGVGAAGCGSTNSGSTTTVVLTKKEFVKQGDAICARADGAQEVAFQRAILNPVKGQSKEEQIVKAGLPPVKREVDELAKLSAPAGDEEEVAELITALRAGLKVAEEDSEAVVSGKGEPFAKAAKLARAYGFKACADPL